VVSVARVANAILALLIGVLSARYFGTSVAKDCYVIAQAVPNLATMILVGGVWSTLLVMLAEIGQHEGIAGQRAFVRRTLRQVSFLLAPVLLLALAFPERVIGLIAPGFGPTRVELAGRLLRFTIFTTLGTVFFTVIRCLFETRSNFIVPISVNLLVPIASLVALVSLVDRIGVLSLAAGPLLGMGLAVPLLGSIALMTLRDPEGFIPRPRAPLLHKERHRHFWAAFIPMSIGANCGQINLLIDNAFASYLPTGSITMLGFAFVIVLNAEQLTIHSLVEVAFPRLVAAGLRTAKDLSQQLQSTLRYMYLVTTPISVGCVVFGAPLARLLFERGEFQASSTHGVARLLACYSLEILFMGHVLALSRVLIARKRFAPLAWLSLGAILTNALLDYVLMRLLGVNGIALATTLVSGLQCVALSMLLRRDAVTLRTTLPSDFLAKVVGSASIMGALVLGWASAFEHALDTSREIPRLIEVLSGVALGAATYVGLLHALRIEEARSILRRFLAAARPLARP